MSERGWGWGGEGVGGMGSEQGEWGGGGERRGSGGRKKGEELLGTQYKVGGLKLIQRHNYRS